MPAVISELGLFALILALMASIAQGVAPLWGAAHGKTRLMRFGASAAIAQFALITFAFMCLVWAFAVSDFSLKVVAANSHTLKPMFYKISAAWGQHEGSMLLWVLVLCRLRRGASPCSANNLPATLQARALGVQGTARRRLPGLHSVHVEPVRAAGSRRRSTAAGFNPLLQDPGLVLHPPLLYLGYVGFSVAFAFAVGGADRGPGRRRLGALGAALGAGRLVLPDRRNRAGQLLGLLRARLGRLVVLGPGRERVLHALAPRHRAAALARWCVERREALVNWTILLSILDLLAQPCRHLPGPLRHADQRPRLRGRSGARRLHPGASSSLHHGGALTLYALRAPSLRSRHPSRLSAAKARSSLQQPPALLIACAVVFLGTFYPLVIDALGGDKISVGPPYFNITFGPIMLGVTATDGVRADDALAQRCREACRQCDAHTDGGRPHRRPHRWRSSDRSLPGGLGIGFGVFLIAGMARWMQVRLRIGQVKAGAVASSSHAPSRDRPGASSSPISASQSPCSASPRCQRGRRTPCRPCGSESRPRSARVPSR